MFATHLAWLLGLISTRDYETKRRRRDLGAEAVEATDEVVRRLEGTLVQDRLALVLFLIGVVVLVFSYLHGPLLV
jgi:membrane-bound ClpP family serine protease